MNKVLNVTLRAAVVVLALVLIWLLFAPKSYGQYVPRMYSKKQDSCAPKYRWATSADKYITVKDSVQKFTVLKSYGRIVNGATSDLADDGASDIQISKHDKPIRLKIGNDEYVIWNKKVYVRVKPD